MSIQPSAAKQDLSRSTPGGEVGWTEITWDMSPPLLQSQAYISFTRKFINAPQYVLSSYPINSHRGVCPIEERNMIHIYLFSN
jgi:hypothetical protein